MKIRTDNIGEQLLCAASGALFVLATPQVRGWITKKATDEVFRKASKARAKEVREYHVEIQWLERKLEAARAEIEDLKTVTEDLTTELDDLLDVITASVTTPDVVSEAPALDDEPRMMMMAKPADTSRDELIIPEGPPSPPYYRGVIGILTCETCNEPELIWGLHGEGVSSDEFDQSKYCAGHAIRDEAL